MADLIFPDDTVDIGAALNAADYFLVADASASNAAKDILISALMTYIIANIDASDISLGNVTNTSDADKPVSTAQQAEIDTKAEVGFQSGFTHTSSSSPVEMDANEVLTVTHDLANAWPSCVTIWDNLKNTVEPDEITSVDANSLTIDLGSYGAITGTWYVSILGV